MTGNFTKKAKKERKERKKNSPHRVSLNISPLTAFFFFSKLYQIGFQPSAMSKRTHKCSRQSLCLGRAPLVHADEGRQSQDQVPAGQRDVRASCAPIGCSVGSCGQGNKRACD